MLYAIIAVFGMFVRQFMLPDPFEPLGEGIVVKGVLLSPIILNWIAEPILHIISFVEVGIVYQKGEMPGLGSLLYLMAYVVNTVVLLFASWLGLHWYTNLTIVVLYIAGLVWFIRSNDI